jgi:hypothetical protein
MGLHVLERSLRDVQQNAESMDFATLIRSARDSIGLKSYRAAEFVGICPARLKNLEVGYFRSPLSEGEIKGFSMLYDLPENVVRKKVDEHIELVKEQRRKRWPYGKDVL